MKAVLNSFFFYEKISHALKALKALNGTKTLGQKHKNANKRISDYFPLRCFLRVFLIFICLQAFCAFLWLLKLRIKKSKIALVTSFTLLLSVISNLLLDVQNFLMQLK